MPPVPAGFFSAAEIQAAVAEQVERVRRKNQSIDYLTFFPSGEPTLDMNLEPMITQLKALGFKHRGHYQRLAAVAVKGKICIIAGRLGLAKSRCSQCSYLAPHQPPSQRSSFSTHYGCDT
jgi:hypothetical protein